MLAVPFSILVAAAAGLGSSFLFAIPSVTIEFPGSEARGLPSETVALLVQGVRCVDTAEGAASTLEDLPGVFRFVAYASRARLEIEFDPKRIGRGDIVEALESPVLDEASGEYRFGVYHVLEIDGGKVVR